ncbi:TetR/AcrR family transcriptional regulator [Streptomyces meridianus]|uniref:TetR/AcrR family transcriptional regulator n=1 Tax=Streptomyces meridianus TaxID=2938945 RepID=A0ABT0X6B1_9ACTN|nr:TetR/AcrR family transcriptional regulator [Streptomyces meridianus]MCM2577805.1 TetR/AcrR family transcriptional regulator [Streptomyces meridianus]
METTDADGCRGRGRRRCPDKGAAILAATLTLLAEQGFARMTLEGVARAAGVSKATLHLRFRSKSALAAAALRTLRHDAAPPDTGDVSADVVARLADFAATLTQARGTTLIGACLAEQAHTPELLELFREHAVRPRREAMRRLLERARARGALVGGADPDLLASALLGTFWADRLAGRSTDRDWARRTAAAVLDPMLPP